MGVFEDSKLEQLDWMTQMTETIDSNLNVILAQLPDRVKITANMIISAGSNSYMAFSANEVITSELRRLSIKGPSWDEFRLIEECFKFEVIGSPEIDLREGIIRGGEVCLVKTTTTLSDEQLLRIMGHNGISKISLIAWDRNIPLERLNEVLDILGSCKEHMNNRSVKKKLISIKKRLITIFETNEWRIRDAELADKVGCWIKDYIVEGNLAALTNLCKLKVMTHNNMPIYSVKEEQ